MKGINKYLVALVIVFQVQHKSLAAQKLYYQDTFYGGITGAGFSTGEGSGSGTFQIFIEPGSTIKKAFLFTYRIGYALPVNITLNGNPFIPDTVNNILSVMHSATFCNPVTLNISDITDVIDSSITNYNVDIPAQFGLPLCWSYCTVYLLVLYENPSLGKANCSIVLNEKNLLGNEQYTITGLNPIDTTSPAGLALYTDRSCDSVFNDGNEVFVNTQYLGLTYGPDNVSAMYSCPGVQGHFYYQDSLLYGLDDDTPDSIMAGSDALADISYYLNQFDTGFTLQLLHQRYPFIGISGYPNWNLAYFLSYLTPCDTFTAEITSNDTLICYGDSTQLNAYGGIKYKWKPSIGLSCDTCANPFANPDSSTLYTCTIYNTDSCSKVLPIKVNVRPPISFNTTTIPTTCGLQDGSITITNIVNATAPFTYIINGAPQPTNIFTALDTGMYLLSITDSNACKSVQVVVVLNDTNYVTANFSSIPITGVTPLDVNFNYTGNNGTNFIWSFGSGDSSFINNPNYVFNNAGSFIVTLITWANDSTCSDTASATLLVSPALVITQFVSPNNDGQNDTWIIQGLSLYPKAGVEIFNRWGNLVYSSEPYQNDWAGECAEPTCIAQGGILPTGTYFYYLYLNGKSNTSANEIKSGYLELQP